MVSWTHGGTRTGRKGRGSNGCGATGRSQSPPGGAAAGSSPPNSKTMAPHHGSAARGGGATNAMPAGPPAVSRSRSHQGWVSVGRDLELLGQPDQVLRAEEEVVDRL